MANISFKTTPEEDKLICAIVDRLSGKLGSCFVPRCAK